jgi:magnesium chelatase family protein
LLAQVHSTALVGIDPYPVEVEIDVYPGMASIAVVGLPDNGVKESTARVKSAIINSGYPFPARRVTVKPTPAGIKVDAFPNEPHCLLVQPMATNLRDRRAGSPSLVAGSFTINTAGAKDYRRLRGKG